jgi:SpoVK/Ycf46/Vps4 family AAA+-type ATPase
MCTLIDMATKAKVQGKKRKPVSEEIRWVSGDDYSLDLLNTTMDPSLVLAMTDAAKRKDGARILFSGPSGTGKTELAKYLAHELKVPLIQRRADELMRYRLGASERAIRDSFRQAYDEGAILFLDEFENLVQQRREGNNASIIEMTTTTILAELDRYRGLFVACTNHPDVIDRAMLRRFTLKVNFMPLRPKDRERAYYRYLAKFGGELNLSEQGQLSRLEGLSLGDIGNILRRLELMSGIPSYETAQKSEVIGMLAQEVALRLGKESPRIGFPA